MMVGLHSSALSGSRSDVFDLFPPISLLNLLRLLPFEGDELLLDEPLLLLVSRRGVTNVAPREPIRSEFLGNDKQNCQLQAPRLNNSQQETFWQRQQNTR